MKSVAEDPIGSRETMEVRNQQPRFVQVRPILRWVGGKQLLIKQLLRYCPLDARERRYYEPFLGGASLFLALNPKAAFLSDANSQLINAYRQICKHPVKVAKLFQQMSEKDSTKFYYSTRTLYNGARSSVLQTARFLYLNRTCFNGIFRVNKINKFNVPYGHKAKPWFPNSAELRAFAGAFRYARIFVEDYQQALTRPRSGDFVYLDPPYPPLNGTSNFAHYTMDRFGVQNQHDLADQVKELDQRGCLVMVTNADTKLIRKLYRGLNLHTIEVTRYVTCKAIRHQVRELVISNY